MKVQIPSALKVTAAFFVLGTFYDLQKENSIDEHRGCLKSFEADTDAYQGSEKG